MQTGNAMRFSGTVEMTIHFDGKYFGVSFWEADDSLQIEPLREISLASGKHFADDGEAFDEAAQVAIGFAGMLDERLFAFVQLEGDKCIVWREREVAELMHR